MKIEDIKFKAKKLNSCEWVEGDLVHLGNRVCIGGDHLKDGIADVDTSTVCQFTGLKDYEDKEIWEGDIAECEIYDLYKGFIKVKAVIEYMYGAFVAIIDGIPNSLYFKYIKVIGNKFDNDK